MKKPSKARFKDALKHAKELGKPVIVGWGVMHSLRSPAIIETPRYGRADQKGSRWFRQHYREAWIASPDGSAYDVFDPVASTFAIEDPDPKSVPAYVPGHGIVDVPRAVLNNPDFPTQLTPFVEIKSAPAFLVQQRNAGMEMESFVKAALATGKVQMQIPPDCFLWTGTQEELHEFFKKWHPPVAD